MYSEGASAHVLLHIVVLNKGWARTCNTHTTKNFKTSNPDISGLGAAAGSGFGPLESAFRILQNDTQSGSRKWALRGILSPGRSGARISPGRGMGSEFLRIRVQFRTLSYA
jgi:hypothetical protein